MIRVFNLAFMEWRGDKEMVNLGVSTKQEKYRVENWKFKDYFKLAKEEKCLQQ